MNPYEAYYQYEARKRKNSLYEDTLFSQIKHEGLEIPTREFVFLPDRKFRFDFAWTEIKLAMEVEGGTWSNGRHTRGLGYENDCVKYNEAALAGWKVLRVTTNMVKDLRALNLLKRALPDGHHLKE